MDYFRMTVLYCRSLVHFCALLRRVCEVVEPSAEGHLQWGAYVPQLDCLIYFRLEEEPVGGAATGSMLWRIKWSEPARGHWTNILYAAYIEATKESPDQTRVDFLVEEDSTEEEYGMISPYLEQLAYCLIKSQPADFKILDAPMELPRELVRLGFINEDDLQFERRAEAPAPQMPPAPEGGPGRHLGAQGGTLGRARSARELIVRGVPKTKACKQAHIDTRTYNRYDEDIVDWGEKLDDS